MTFHRLLDLEDSLSMVWLYM